MSLSVLPSVLSTERCESFGGEKAEAFTRVEFPATLTFHLVAAAVRKNGGTTRRPESHDSIMDALDALEINRSKANANHQT